MKDMARGCCGGRRGAGDRGAGKLEVSFVIAAVDGIPDNPCPCGESRRACILHLVESA